MHAASTLGAMTASPGRQMAQHQQPTGFAALAREAGLEVNARFGHRLLGLPGTWIGAVETPSTATGSRIRPLRQRTSSSPWHYWWQAHFLDAVVDAAYLALAQGNRTEAHVELQRAQALLRGIWIRNFGRFRNDFFDDMAWLALAASRLNALSQRLTARPLWLARQAIKTLTRQLHGGYDDVLGGGLYWSSKRDFKNTPANGPAALHFARMGITEQAAAILDWLRTELFDPSLGLYLDGVHPTEAGRSVEKTIYTYNQGPVLAAMLELGRPQDLEHAAALIEAVRHRLSTPCQFGGPEQLSPPGQGIRLESGGDGGLFTGILCRYLASAARDPRLPEKTRETASGLVRETAIVVAGQSSTELSHAVQRWSVLSAAAAL